MSKNKKSDGVFTQFYEPHLSGNFRNNRPRNRLQLHENVWIRHLTELTANRFKWRNLPDSVDERFLELTLLRNGAVLFYKYMSENYPDKYLVSRFTIGGGALNHYDNPTNFQPIATSLVPDVVGPRNAVPIYNNYLRTPEMDIVMLYATKFAQIDTVIESNVENTRKTKAITAGETQRLTAENTIRQISESVPVLYFNDSNMGFNADSVSVLDLGPHHETLPNLIATKAKMYNECLNMLGVSVVNQDKKERMITGEVDASQDQAMVTRNIAHNSRKMACDQINNLFPDLNISVDWNADNEQQQSVMYTDDYGSVNAETDNDEMESETP